MAGGFDECGRPLGEGGVPRTRVYAPQAWVAILNPGEATADLARSLFTDAHARAVRRHDRRRAAS